MTTDCKPMGKKILRSVFKQSWYGFTALLFPRICLICERRIDGGDNPVCPQCWNGLRRLSPEIIHSKQPENGLLDTIYPVFEFNDAVQTIIHGLKYSGFKSLGIKLGRLMTSFIPADFFCADTVLIPIPLHPIKFRERGYNQSSLLARGIAEKTGLVVREDILHRVKNTVTQTHLDAQERLLNMERAFAISRRGDCAALSSIVLVDDVFTTGATIGAAAAVLKATGVAAVRGLTAAAPM